MQQILVVDDELEHLNALCELLQGGGYQVLRTSRPERALAIAESQRPDLVITDWDMPGLSGIELIRQLKAHPATRDIPVIMCTGSMTTAAHLETALQAGAVDYVRKPVEPIELRARTRSMLQLAASYRQILAKEQELARQNELLNQQKQELHQAAITDRLTGLHNRAYLVDQLSREFSNSRRYGRPLSCLLLDIDHFKSVNDRHGHLVGDAVLRHTAQLLSRGLRRGDVLARYGGEEFVLLLPGTPAASAQALAESLRASVAQAVWVQGELSLPLTISIGVADNLAGQAEDETALLRHADAALYAAKRQGRNRVVVHAEPVG
ncbi:GGDEF domain-containing response regulator [Inhella proteolytica]|uniref:diguanylate cyclase n=1 Tax=Inhella proteolytica TaxID=2795029 RepID=A0A931J3U8_9BURK|nr:diguanylate cyclase [Inhella proteolytica]MBH9577258.1 diguanylate cyclase [Inhella proteolytica]